MKHAIVITLLSASCSFASTPQPPSVKPAAVVTEAPPEAITLVTASTGVRTKKVFLVNVKVYEATLMIPKGAVLKKDVTGTAGLDSLMAMSSSSITLKLLRDVDADTLIKGFDDALKHNKVEASTGLQTLKAHLKKTAKMTTGHQITLTANRAAKKLICNDGTQKLEIADEDGNVARDLFKIWLGEPYDNGLKTLKAQLLK